MTDIEIEALRHEFGLDHVHEPVALRSAVEQKLAAMNALDRTAIRIRIGTRLKELQAISPGSRYSPPTWTLLLTAVVFVTCSAGSLTFVSRVALWFPLKIFVAFVALMFFVAAWRAAARVIYRAVNRRDW